MESITISEFIALKRKEKEIKQKDFANNSGCCPAYLCLVEKGKETASLGLLVNIAENLGYQIEEFLVLWYLENNPEKKFTKKTYQSVKNILKEIITILL